MAEEDLIAPADTGSASKGDTEFPDFGIGESVSDALGDIKDSINEPFQDIQNFFSDITDTDKKGLSVSLVGSTLGPGAALGLAGAFALADAFEEKGSAALTEDDGVAVEVSSGPEFEPEINVLHGYANSTYRLTLGAQNLTDFNVTADAGFTSGVPKMTTVLMTSGGADNDTFERHSAFEEDFYLEALQIMTVIGQSSFAQGSNSVKVEFEIIEPYAVSLIERLLILATDLNIGSYMEIPFVLRIDFIGYDSNGVQIGIIPNTTKYIPIRFASLTFKINESGTSYKVIAIPYNHMAMNKTVATLPTQLEVAAEKVNDIFNQNQEAGGGNGHKLGLVETINNFYMAQTVSKNGKAPERDHPDKIKIVVSDKIGNETLIAANLSKVPEGTVGDKAAQTGAKRANNIPNTTKSTYSFGTGSSILSMIQTIVKNSTYYTKQLKDETNTATNENDEKDLKQEKPLNVVRVTSSYKMGDYDTRIHRHAYEVTYYVNPYAISGQSNPIGPQKAPEFIAKQYDYLFTGENQDILDLDIEFNLAYYIHRSTGLESAGTGTAQAVTSDKKANADVKTSANNNDIMSQAEIHIGTPKENNKGAAGSKEQVQKIKAADLHDSIMTDANGDMFVIDMEILGDPVFIKQDDLLHRIEDTSGRATSDTGSLLMDQGEIYIKINFNVFDDIDHDTGLRLQNRSIPNSDKQRTSSFTGIYRIMTLDSTFASGQFTQNLHLYRVHIQPEEK